MTTTSPPPWKHTARRILDGALLTAFGVVAIPMVAVLLPYGLVLAGIDYALTHALGLPREKRTMGWWGF